VSEPQRGEVWWAEVAEAGRRPFLVLTRTRAISVLHSVLAAPLTRTVRGIPTELSLSPDDVCQRNAPQASTISAPSRRTTSRSESVVSIRFGCSRPAHHCELLSTAEPRSRTIDDLSRRLRLQPSGLQTRSLLVTRCPWSPRASGHGGLSGDHKCTDLMGC